MTRYFATLGPSRLQPPLTRASFGTLNAYVYYLASGRYQTLYIHASVRRVRCFK